MRFTLMLGIGGFQDYQAVARAAEDSGWASISMPDSIFFPEKTESDYPYADTEAVRGFIGGHTKLALNRTARIGDVGATDICAVPWNVYDASLNLQVKIDGIRRFGDEVIAKM